MPRFRVRAVENHSDFQLTFDDMAERQSEIKWSDWVEVGTALNHWDAAWKATEIKPEWVGIQFGFFAIEVILYEWGTLSLRYRSGQLRDICGVHSFPVDAHGLDVADIVKVTASGEFLIQIRAQFFGLPDCEERAIVKAEPRFDTVSWYGDNAKFIVGNFKVQK